jgi:S-adenosylmethionine-dependent methyltransferase
MSMKDVSFDNHIERFKKNINEAPKGIIRRHVIKQALQDLLPELYDGRKSMSIADVGGGLGQDTMNFVRLGHHVDYFDTSEAMAREAADLTCQEKASEKVNIHIGPFQINLTSSYELVFVQALLEWLADPFKGLNLLIEAVEPGGFLALVFYNKHSVVLRNLIRGNFHKVDSDTYRGDGKGLTPLHPLLPEKIYELLRENDFEVRGKRGIRCFSDLCFPHVPVAERIKDVVRLETSFSKEEPYCSLARYIFTVAQKKQF